jgi:prenyltransferase beta subunit
MSGDSMMGLATEPDMGVCASAAGAACAVGDSMRVMSVRNFLEFPASNEPGLLGVMKTLETQKHVEYIKSLDCTPADLAYWLSEHLRINGLYWGNTCLLLLDRQDVIDKERMVQEARDCLQPNGFLFNKADSGLQRATTRISCTRFRRSNYSHHLMHWIQSIHKRLLIVCLCY